MKHAGEIIRPKLLCVCVTVDNELTELHYFKCFEQAKKCSLRIVEEVKEEIRKELAFEAWIEIEDCARERLAGWYVDAKAVEELPT